MIIKESVRHNVNFKDFLMLKIVRAYLNVTNIFFKAKDRENQPVFVFGCGHSGTTLLAAKISNHRDVFGINRETGFALPHYSGLYFMDRIYQEWSHFAESSDKKVILEKTPKHIHSYKKLTKCFPKAKFIVLTRNPHDNIASLYKRFEDFDYCVQRWNIDNREALKILKEKNVLHIDYDSMTEDPELWFSQALEFIGVDKDLTILNRESSIYDKSPKKVSMPLRNEQVSKPIKPNQGSWRKTFTKEQVDIINKDCATVMNKLGYERVET